MKFKFFRENFKHTLHAICSLITHPKSFLEQGRVLYTMILLLSQYNSFSQQVWTKQ